VFGSSVICSFILFDKSLAHESYLVFDVTPITAIPPSESVSQSVESASNSSSSSYVSMTSPIVPHRIHPHNTHSMKTRGKLGIVQPRLHLTLLLTQYQQVTNRLSRILNGIRLCKQNMMLYYSEYDAIILRFNTLCAY